MRILFIGPQGSGKGTQAQIVSEKLGIPHISTGELLRNATGDLRKDIDSYIVKGNLYPDEKMLNVLEKRFYEKDCEKGFILDGFPRNVKQVEMLEKITHVDEVIEIHVSDEESVRRLESRVSCGKCGTTYGLNKMPKKEGICDYEGAELIRRADDNPEAIRKRLATYHRETEPILGLYKSVRVNGEQSVEDVSKEILKALGR
ncbi:MAG: nucleoside monophosphate kinase [Nanoarchaeota archaeon]|nr:nucleoside monophosphate kinase [Nanoarchaeota archaeon]